MISLFELLKMFKLLLIKTEGNLALSSQVARVLHFNPCSHTRIISDTRTRIIPDIQYPLCLTYVFKKMMYPHTSICIKYDTVSVPVQLSSQAPTMVACKTASLDVESLAVKKQLCFQSIDQCLHLIKSNFLRTVGSLRTIYFYIVWQPKVFGPWCFVCLGSFG